MRVEVVGHQPRAAQLYGGLCAVGHDVDRVEVGVVREHVGDLRDAISLGVDQHHLELAVARPGRAKGVHQRSVVLQAAVHEHDLVAPLDDRSELRDLLPVLQQHDLGRSPGVVAILEQGAAEESGVHVAGQQDPRLQRLEERPTVVSLGGSGGHGRGPACGFSHSPYRTIARPAVG
jgi:hypothetical protein